MKEEGKGGGGGCIKHVPSLGFSQSFFWGECDRLDKPEWTQPAFSVGRREGRSKTGPRPGGGDYPRNIPFDCNEGLRLLEERWRDAMEACGGEGLGGGRGWGPCAGQLQDLAHGGVGCAWRWRGGGWVGRGGVGTRQRDQS